MTRRARRMVWMALGILGALVLVLAVTGVLVLRSGWFREKIRERMIAEIEKATGGRAQIGAFRFDWKQRRAEVEDFVLHGSEPADGPPLFRADSIAVGLKIISVFKRSADIAYLDVKHPQVYVIVGADGHTNLPAPKVRSAGKGAIETILDLAIGRFSLQNGAVEIAGRGRTPFDARGQNLRAQFDYDVTGPRYRGQLSMAPADFGWESKRVPSFDISLALAVEKNRVQIDSGRIRTALSQADFSGDIHSLADFSATFGYKVRLALGEVNRALAWHTQLEGPVMLVGVLNFHGAADFEAKGSMHAAGLYFHPDPHFMLRNFNADGAMLADPRHVEVNGMRLRGLGMLILTGQGRDLQPIPLQGRIEKAVFHQKTIDTTGIHLEELNGFFAGDARIADFDRVHVHGEVSGFDVRQMMLVYNGQSVPWDGAAAGPVDLLASLRDSRQLRVVAHTTISPAGAGPAVHGLVDSSYDGAAGTLDLGHSILELPATHAEFSGVLGRVLRVQASSRNVDDVLPAFAITSLPVKLQNGQAAFDGSVAGPLDEPHIVGHASATNLAYAGRVFNALAGDVDLTSAGLAVQNGRIEQGALRAQGSGSVTMHDWTVDDRSAIAATGSLRNAAAADLLATLDARTVPLQGTVQAEGKISGTLADPRVDAGFTVVDGAVASEPFERFTGTLHYSGQTIDLVKAQLAAGARQVAFQASYQHQAGSLASGRLRFQVDSSAMPLDQFHVVRTAFAGLQGNVETHAEGLVDIAPAKPGQAGFRLVYLDGKLTARGVRINGQPVHDINLTAATKGVQLTAHVDSALAGSVIRGDGQWALAGDYPGNAQISFTQLDLTRLLAWLGHTKPPGGVELAGSAEGTLSVSGPAIKPELWKADLKVPSLHVGPGGDLAAKGNALALHNPAPIVITMEHDVIKVENARLTGRTTDLSLTGSVNLQQKNPLDLRVSGKFDLATLQDFNPDIYSNGSMETGVTVRGPMARPLVNGRLDIKDATFNLADLPVGIYKANGVILFDDSRATIQSFSSESGGGRMELSGFAGYGGNSIVFRLHANAHEVRVRYPEDFSTVADASLSLTGASDSSMLSGRVTVRRTGFNPRSDFSSVLAKSAEPVRTPSAETGLLANMHYDVQIDSATDITFQSSLAQGMQGEASLRLRGTAANPSLLGRINVTQGQIVFFGTQFSVNQGSIAFYNPVKIDPVLNIDLETKARGIDVILNISGPINKLNLTPRSDPPMPFTDVIALLATGRSPNGSDTTVLSSPASSQSLQQLGASALLGQAMASPVTGRLQRFFGVTRLKIDPTLTGLTGVGYNPQARLTVEQQVTPDITFTYITNVTNTNPLVVQVEWAFSRNWSVVALRDENGLFGMNFQYKHRFK